jgi:multidrug efflux pump subunit AcrA (membrane-fusion protein)
MKKENSHNVVPVKSGKGIRTRRFSGGLKGGISGASRTVNGAGLLCVFILAAVFFSGCERIKESIKEVYGKKEIGGPIEQEAPVYAVNTTLAVKGQIRDYLALSGDIIAGSTVDAYSDAAGKVTEVYVSVGDRVSRGDRIAAVDPSRPGLTYRIGYATSPISGTVVMLPAQVGMTITQAVPVARIAGGGALEIRLYVAERFVSKMALNLPCEITLDAWPGIVFQGSISEVSPTLDVTSRTMEVKVNVRNADSRLKAGMFAKVKVITTVKNNIVKIPASAVINRFGENYVFVVDNTNPENPVVQRRVIVTGILIDGIMEVQQGLMENEEIVVRGQTLLNDGARVNIVEQASPLSSN